MSKRQRNDVVETVAHSVGVRKVPGALALSQTEHEHHTETNHVLSRHGTDACDEDGSLRPGHNACAVCAAIHCLDTSGEVVIAVSALIKCGTCRKVSYCSSKHQTQDAIVHRRVCSLLSRIHNTETTVDSGRDSMNEALSLFPSTALDMPCLRSWSDVVPTELQSSLHLALRTSTNKNKRVRFNDVLDIEPPHVSAETGDRPVVAAAPQESGDNGSANPLLPSFATAQVPSVVSDTIAVTPDRRANITVATAASSLPPAYTVNDPVAAAAAVVPAVGVASSSSSPFPPTATPPACPQSLERSARLGMCTEVLSAPLTVLHAVQTDESMKAVVAAVGSKQGQSLVLCILVAAEVQLKVLDVWKALDGLNPGGTVLLQFIGAEVPVQWHGRSQELTTTMQASFYRGMYAALAGTATAQRPVGFRAAPHILIGFNLGLTSPDCDWLPSLLGIKRDFDGHCLQKRTLPVTPQTSARRARLPLLLCANTLVEASMERELVSLNHWVTSQSPAEPHRNPFGSLLPTQSGTLANDVYYSNAWVSCYDLMEPAVRRSLSYRVKSWLRTAVSAPLRRFRRIMHLA